MTTASHDTPGMRIVALLFCAALVEGFDLQAAGVAAPKLAAAFGLTPGQLGLYFSSVTGGLILGGLSGGIIADRFGRRTGLILSLLTFGVFSIATTQATTYEALVALRLLTGLGLGGALPILISMAAEAVPPERRGRAVSLMYAGVPLGGAGAALSSMLGLHGGWQTIFLVGGLLPLILSVPLYLMLPPMHVTREVKTDTGRWKALFVPGTILNTLLLWAAFFGGMIVIYILVNWLPQLVIGLGFAPGQAALMQVLFSVSGAGGSLLGGRILDGRRPARAAAGWFGLLILSIGALALVPAGHILTALAVVVLLGIALLGAQALLYCIAPQCYPAPVRGTGVGLAISVGRGGSVLGPLLAGFLLTSGLSPQQVLYAILPIVALWAVAAVILTTRQT